MTKKEIIEDILCQCYDGVSRVELAETYTTQEVKDADLKLYAALKRLDEAAKDMVARLHELNEELDLGFGYI